jgi:hypothetical protein
MFFSSSIRKFLFLSLLSALIVPICVKSDFGDVATATVLASGGWGIYKLGVKAYDLYVKYGNKDKKNTHGEEKNKDDSSELLQHSADAPWSEIKERYYKYLEAKPWGAVSKRYIEAFKKEEQELLQEFFTAANVSEQTFEHYKNMWHHNFAAEYQQHDEVTSPRIDNQYSKLFKSNFKTIGIAPSKLDFRECHDVREPYAAAAFNTIYINLRKIPQCKTIEIAIVAFHELMHVMHEDRLNTLTIQNLMKSRFKAFETRYIRFKERRADILALLLNPKLAKHTAKWYSNDQEVSDYSRKLYDEMNVKTV